MCACMRACVHACVHACVRACVNCVCVCTPITKDLTWRRRCLTNTTVPRDQVTTWWRPLGTSRQGTWTHHGVVAVAGLVVDDERQQHGADGEQQGAVGPPVVVEDPRRVGHLQQHTSLPVCA